MNREKGQRQNQMKDGDRGQWENKTEYILVVAGNVVGLGNVWRFPYLCYKNGGGAFLVPYGLLAVVCGIPLFLLEIFSGQYTQEGFITCWRKLCPLAQGIGCGHTVSRLYDFSYIIIEVWALFYLVFSFKSQLPWTNCENTWNSGKFNCISLHKLDSSSPNVTENQTMSTNTTSAATEFWERRVLAMSGGIEELGSVRWELALCLLFCWVVSYFSIWKGVRSSGKVAYFTATFPYVMLLILLVRGLTLPGAWDGIRFYLNPDLSRLADLEVWVEAGSQIYFSYSICVGTLTVLGSYNNHNNNCYKDCFWLCLLNSGTSFLAGFVVFSVLGFMAHTQGVSVDNVADSGPGLVFIAYPQATAMMPFPQFWSVCFFLMLFFLSVDTNFVIVESFITSISDLFPKLLRAAGRSEIFVLIICLLFFFIHLTLVTEGGIYIFQLVDYYGCTRAVQDFVAFSECLALAWGFGADRVIKSIEDMTGHRPSVFFKVCWKYIIPLLSLISFILYLVGYTHLKVDHYTYPDWAYALGWIMTLSSVLMVPLWAAGQMCLTPGTFTQRLHVLCRPAEDPAWQRKETQEEGMTVELRTRQFPPAGDKEIFTCYLAVAGAFLVPYGLFAVVCGIPLFLLEIFSGQYTQEGFITCWRKLCPLAQGIGCGHTVTRLYDFSYIIIEVWALFYLVFSFKSQLPWANCENTWNSVNCISLHKLDSSSPNVTENQTMSTNTTSAASEFWERRVLAMSGGIEELGSVRWELALCLLFCWVVTYFSIWKGVRSSGKVAYFTATFPYVMLLILLVRGLTLPGAWDGIRFYLNPDLSRLADIEVWVEAGSQICFSYSICLGTLIVLGSYNNHNNNCYKDCFWLCLLNSGTSFLAGFVVFSVLGFMAHTQGVSVDNVADSGPGLVFIAYPQATAMMPFPQFWSVCFFLMLFFLSIDTNISFILYLVGYTHLKVDHYTYPDWAYALGWIMTLSSVLMVPLWAAGQMCLTPGTFTQMKDGDRGQWANKTEYILVVAGTVVGLGNVWRFPYLCYKNGGGAFLLPYGLLAVVYGIPLFLLETSSGQYTQEGFITCWSKFCPLAQGVGCGQTVMKLYDFSYIIVEVWALLYLVFSFKSQLPWANCENTWNSVNCIGLQILNSSSPNVTENQTMSTNTTHAASEFWERRVLAMSGGIEELGSVRWELALCLLFCWVVTYFSIWKSVRSSGKVAYFTATFPYVMLLILLVRGLTLPGAWDGIRFYLNPDLSRLADVEVWIEAGSQICFSYSVSSGVLIVLGSYNCQNNNCYKDCFWLCLLNSGTSFLAGFVVFSVLGFMAHTQGVSVDNVADSGPGLVFIAYPQATAMMPFPQFWSVCFFLMLFFLSIDSHFVIVESFITSISDLFPKLLRAAGRSEIFVLIVCSFFFFIHLTLVTKISFILYLVGYTHLKINNYTYPSWVYTLGWAMTLSSVLLVPLVCTSFVVLLKIQPGREKNRRGGGSCGAEDISSAFLVPYGLLAVVCGIPLFLLETFSGQYTQEGFITCWRKLCPLAQGIGCGQTVTKLYDFSYIIIEVWALFYLVFSFKSQLPWANCENTWNSVNCVSLPNVDSSSPNMTENETMLTNPTSAATEFWERRVLAMSGGIEELGSVRWELALCLLFSWVVTYFSIWKGVRSSGKVAYFTATFPYAMLLILLIRGLTLPGAWDGIRFYLNPDLSRLADLEVWTEAGSQICFSYSLSSGILVVLGSYNNHNNNCYKDCFWLCLLNSGTSFLAGFVVFSVLGFMAHTQGVSVDNVADTGPGLVFIAYPQATAMMPFPQFWSVCFFLMLFFLSVDTNVSCFD
ncbi:hypothetical protein INR49_007914, partial [Caranx melampygus]